MEEKSKKFKIATLGCRTNQYESQAYQSQLEAMGYTPSNNGEVADICIVNTCTVTESADSHSRHEIRKLARENPNSQLIVTGCFADGQQNKVRAFEGVTHVVANKDKENLLAVAFPEEELPEFSIQRFEAHTRAFVKIQDGCDSYCTYCIIPYVRGRSRSRPIVDILKEVTSLIANGYQEIVLTGINVGDFEEPQADSQKTHRLADLVRMVDQIEGLKRLRISSIDPDEVDDDLLDAVINGRHTCPSMHVVLQSGSNVILKRMNRKYTRQIFMDTVMRLRAANPDFTFTTDVIVGFPGETDADFAETLAVMQEVEFAKVHMFPYSDRPRTRSAAYSNKVPVAIIKERKQQVLRLAEQIAFSLRARYVNRQMSVLIERSSLAAVQGELDEITGHTANFLAVQLVSDAPNKAYHQNEMIEVKLIENRAQGLIGVPID